MERAKRRRPCLVDVVATQAESQLLVPEEDTYKVDLFALEVGVAGALSADMGLQSSVSSPHPSTHPPELASKPGVQTTASQTSR